MDSPSTIGITADSCGASETRAPTSSSKGASSVDIGYANSGNKAVTEIEWGFVLNGNVAARIRDTNALAPGAHADHTFNLPYDVFPHGRLLGKIACVALRVRFADGASWTNPAPPSLSIKAVATPPPGMDLELSFSPPESGVDVSSQSLSANGTPPALTIQLKYTNTSTKQIRAVEWCLAADGIIFATFTDSRVIAAHATVDRTFSPNVELPSGVKMSDVSLHVLHVTFADGTQWPREP